MTEVVLPEQRGTLALAGDQTDWTPVQRAALSHLGIADAPAADQQVFRHVAQRAGLDPFAKQIWMIPRKERDANGVDRIKWTIQTAIDGFRLIAERHPQYAGTLDPEWCGEDGVWREAWTDRRPPVMARVKVLRHDRAHPISLPVRFDEFAATFRDGNLMGQWKTRPAHMLAKVAEAASLRKAFPQDFSGIYTDDEVSREDARRSSVAPRVVLEHDAQPVTAAELTGAAPDPAPADHGGRMTQPQQGKLFALIREAEIADRNTWASTILGRDITSFGQLSVADAARLIDNLEASLSDDEHDGADS